MQATPLNEIREPVLQELTDWVWVRPPTWSTHKLGGNYLAIITPDESAPGGLSRKFQPRAKGIEGMVCRHLAPGDAFELGGVTTDTAGTVKPRKVFGIVVRVAKTQLLYVPATKGMEACTIADTIVSNLHNIGAEETLQRRYKQMVDQYTALNGQMKEVQTQLQAMKTGEMTQAEERAEAMGAVARPEPAAPTEPTAFDIGFEDEPEEPLPAAEMLDPVALAYNVLASLPPDKLQALYESIQASRQFPTNHKLSLDESG